MRVRPAIALCRASVRTAFSTPVSMVSDVNKASKGEDALCYALSEPRTQKGVVDGVEVLRVSKLECLDGRLDHKHSGRGRASLP